MEPMGKAKDFWELREFRAQGFGELGGAVNMEH